MDTPIRILHVIAGMGSGGAEMLIMNWYRSIDRTKVQFDFLLRSEENQYRDEIVALGGRIFTMPEFPRHLLRNHRETRRFFAAHAGEYTAIHVHGNALIYTDALRLAKRYGIARRIMHSHNTRTEHPIYLPVHWWNRLFIKHLATDYWACSEPAGRFAFRTGYTVFNNAIDLPRFAFRADVRERLRREEHWDNRWVVGHIGRFLESKNHPFLLEVFEELHRRRPDAVLALIGTGTGEAAIRDLVRQKGLDDAVQFLGIKTNAPDYYMAFDCMVFPSLFEGLGIVAVEAQAAGLPTVASEAIPPEARITELLSVHSLRESAVAWADAVMALTASVSVRPDTHPALTAAGFNAEVEIAKLQNAYLSMKTEN